MRANQGVFGVGDHRSGYHSSYYRANREKRLAQTRARHDLKRQVVAQARQSPCADCGEYKPGAMEFDHLPERGPKSFTIANIGSFGLPRLREELAKCELVCNECHKVRTARRKCHAPDQQFGLWQDAA